MILGRFRCVLCAEVGVAWGDWGVTAVCFGGIITGTFTWEAGRFGYLLGDAMELGVSLFSLNDC